MDLQLKDKLCVVTGSSGGIGKAIATEFARHGAYTIVNGRSEGSTTAAIKDIVAQADAKETHVLPVVGDVSTAEGADSFVKAVNAVEDAVGTKIQVLVNNVGIFHVQEFGDILDSKWQEYYDTNTMSGVRLSRAFLPGMLERNSNGRIVFISSECGLRPLPHMVAYSVSKTSQIALSRALAETTKGTTVTVNSVLPGPTMTDGVKVYMQDFGKKHGIDDLDEAIRKYFSEHETTSLLQRFLNPKEIGDVTAFLSSPLAAGVNGIAQHVDGGIVRHLA